MVATSKRREQYRALNGINWPNPAGGEFRAERGDLVSEDVMPPEIAEGFMVATPDRPADLESIEETAPAAAAPPAPAPEEER